MADRPITEPRSIPQTGILEEKCRENTILTYHLSPQSPLQLFKAPHLFNFIYFHNNYKEATISILHMGKEQFRQVS